MSKQEDRLQLLLKMYDQMFNDINTHITVIWQSAGVLVSAFAIFALAEKQVINVDISAAFIILIAGWLLAHLQDASYWYNRNLVIIANIERQFLEQDDLKHIHYYFGAHRPNNRMITHLRIQNVFGLGIGFIVLWSHLSTRVFPGMHIGSTFDPQRLLPYVILIAVCICLHQMHGHFTRKYREFIEMSPGTQIKTDGIVYGEGHGFPKVKKLAKAETTDEDERAK